jgi:fructose-1-phosphate kinase PfkB-like protein
MTLSAPLVVVGSANADIFVEVDTLPKEGERIVAKSGQTFAGGKGANQASCAARLSYPTYFVGQVWNALLLLLLFLLASIRHPHVSASLDRPRLER